MQEQIQEILLEMHLSRQERQEHTDLSIRLDAIESKLANTAVSTCSCPPTISLHNTYPSRYNNSF